MKAAKISPGTDQMAMNIFMDDNFQMQENPWDSLTYHGHCHYNFKPYRLKDNFYNDDL